MPLTTPRFRVLLADMTETDVQVWNSDYIRWDTTRARQKWPGPEDAPMLWQGFIVWSALRRTGVIPADMPWEAFRDASPQITPLNDDGTPVEPGQTSEEETVDPSLAGVELG